MKAIYLDCFSGISGNMFLGAMLQAGVPVAHLMHELKKLPLEFDLKIEDTEKNGIKAVHVETDYDEHNHHHRSFADIRAMIENAHLNGFVTQNAVAIFENLAAAESKIHGKATNDVTFHEVGAVDSIIDIVGAAICLDYLAIERVFVSKVNTGSGFVECAHGLLPVPAPATAELLKDLPCYHFGDAKELTTPTGAAILKTLAVYEENLPTDFATERVSYGAGTHDLSLPNVLRVYIGEYAGANSAKLCIVETNIDDMNPQFYGYLYERLLGAGAFDVWTTNIMMKKNRPAQKLSVLIEEKDKEKFAEIIFGETTSIGLRVTRVHERVEAVRHIAKVDTEYGEVACKVSAYKGKIVSVSAEYDDCKKLAEQNSVPLKKIMQEAVTELCRRLDV